MSDAFVNRPHQTAISRKVLSLPMRLLVDSGEINPGERMLDYGCGRGDDVRLLRAEGVDAEGYDPFNPRFATVPTTKFPLVTCNYVINTIERSARAEVLALAFSFVSRNGRMFVSARTPAQIDGEAEQKHWPTREDGYITSRARGTFQSGISLQALFALLEELPDARYHAVARWGTQRNFTGVQVWRR